ncbi:BrnT family toxin [Brevundimonas sp. LM2]|uniref:BrnT family toxin n=1 Tax=Brevundimonas sp. LM2 TaxID=1938605 RepID=UPI001C0AEAC7
MEFEWDEAKALSNAAKHGVTFEEVLEVFADPDRRDAPSGRSSDQEARRYATGGSANGC